MSAIQDEIVTGSVAKLVNRLSRDLSSGRNTDIASRKPSNTVKFGTVQYSYKAARDDELDLEVDDSIEVVEDAEPGWMKGKNHSTSRLGFFPINFVHFIGCSQNSGNNVPKVDDTKMKLIDSTRSKSPEAAARKVKLDSPKCRHIVGSTKLECKKCDLKMCSKLSSKTDENVDASSSKEVARVLYAYQASQDDELTLKEVGAIITVVGKSGADPGWCLAEIGGKRGYIPENFVEVIRTTATHVVDAAKFTSSLGISNKSGKPPGLGVSSTCAGRRSAGTSSNFAAMHSTLADALNKPPKTYYKRINAESRSSESEGNERLSHITVDRPKQPNKRPPSIISKAVEVNRSSQAEDNLNSGHSSSLSSAPPVSVIGSPTTSAANTALAHLSTAVLPSALLSSPTHQYYHNNFSSLQKPSSLQLNTNSEDVVRRSEFDQLLKEFESLQKFVTQRVESLEALLVKHGLS